MMNKSLEVIIKLSDFLMIPIILFYWYYSFNLWNPIAIGLLIVAIVQIIIKNKTLGVILATIFSFSSFFLFFAYISELNDFSEFDDKAFEMTLYISIYLFFIIICSGLMYFKYLNKKSFFNKPF